MKIEAEQVLCRFQLSNFIRHGMAPLYEFDAFLPTVDELVNEGLVTLEAVRILRYVSPDTR